MQLSYSTGTQTLELRLVQEPAHPLMRREPKEGPGSRRGPGHDGPDKCRNGGWQGPQNPRVCGAQSWHSMDWTVPLGVAWTEDCCPCRACLQAEGPLPAAHPEAWACSLLSSGHISAQHGPWLHVSADASSQPGPQGL